MAVKPGLGKGLDAFFSSEPSSGEESKAPSIFVNIDRIKPNPQQPRQEISELDEKLVELADSIREHGVLQPLLVTVEPDTNNYILIAGERRLRAAKIAGLEVIPVLERKVTEQERLVLALIENLQRADLTPLETAEAYRQLNEEFNLTQEEIARHVGKSRVDVSNYKRLLNLPDELQNALRDGAITYGHARALLTLSPQAQTEALKTILEKRLNVRGTEELANKLRGEKPPRKESKKEKSQSIKQFEDRLRTQLGTKVSINHGEDDKGSVVIRYYSNEELEAIINQITRT